MLGCLAEKIGMTQVFDEHGSVSPVTILQVGENKVVGIRSEEKNGYCSVQIGYGCNEKEKRKSLVKVYGDKKVPRLIREFVFKNSAEVKLGERIDASVFDGVEFLDVQSYSLGRGFQGVVKRHGMRGGPKTHGSHFHRAPGSVGNCAYPARIFKGKKMPGRMGGVRVTIQNLKLVKIDKENQLILVRGAVPGKKGSLITLKKAIKKS